MKAVIIFASAALAITLVSIVSAQPVREAGIKDSAPVVGRVRMRDKLIPLTRDSVAEGGEAHDIAQGTARLIGDIDPQVQRADPARTQR